MYANKVRRQFDMPEELARQLDALAAKPGSSLTAIMTDAATAWLDREAGNQLDEQFGPRLGLQDRSASRPERKLDALIELLGVFVQHHLGASSQGGADRRSRSGDRPRALSAVPRPRRAKSGQGQDRLAVRGPTEPGGEAGMIMSDPPRLTVRIREACRMTGIGRSKLYKLIQEGEIETIKVGAITLIRVAELERFNEARR